MRICLGLLLALSVAPNPAHASASITRFPVVVRQTYADGTWSELEVRSHREEKFDYVFRTGPRRTHSYRFDLQRHGYWIDMTGSYNFWPYEAGSFSVAFSVLCRDEDYAFANAAADVELECRAMLHAEDDALRLEGIEVSPMAGGPQTRRLPGPEIDPPPRGP